MAEKRRDLEACFSKFGWPSDSTPARIPATTSFEISQPSVGSLPDDHCTDDSVCWRPYLDVLPPCIHELEVRTLVTNLRPCIGVLRTRRQIAASPSRRALGHVNAIAEIVWTLNGNIQLCLKTLSGQVFVERGYLAQLFKATVGLPFRTFLRLTRLANAADLLINADSPVSFIALDLGHTDPSNFIREFHREFAITPAQYRRRMASDL